MSASGSEPKQEARILQAKAFYNQVKADGGLSKFDVALNNFKEVSLRCPCNKALLTSSREVGLPIQEIPLPTCHCKDFISLATSHGKDDKDSLAMYKLAMKPCNCGSGIASCTSPFHIAALDGMSAVCEAQKAYAKAIRYASLLIIIAPHAPEGYLRMIKNLRLRARASRAEVTSQCMYILTQAAASVRTFGDKDHDKLKAIRQMLRADPMQRFPIEIQQMVLENLPYTDLCRALGVSKAWSAACRNPRLWMHLEFVRCWRSRKPRPFRPGVLNDIISNRSQNLARSLTIAGMQEFAMDATQLGSILRALPRLESLSLSGSTRIQWPKGRLTPEVMDRLLSFSDIFTAICEAAPRSLKAIHLDTLAFVAPQKPTWLGTSAFSRIAWSLEEMSLTNLCQKNYGIQPCNVARLTLESIVWPKLEKLTMKAGPKCGQFDRPETRLLPLVSNTPSLKDLTLSSNVNYGDTLPPRSWENLERLSIGPFTGHVPLASPKLRSLELLWYGSEAYTQLFETADPSAGPSNVWLENLEHFYCRKGEKLLPLAIRNFERIQPSCANGTLRSLHISFDLTTRDALDEILNKPAIHALSCEDITTYDLFDPYPSSSNSDAFLDWVDTFPNLHTVGAYPYHKKDEKAWTTIAKLLKRRPDIKTIYTNALFGIYRDELLKRAGKNGVNIIHADRVPEPALKPRT